MTHKNAEPFIDEPPAAKPETGHVPQAESGFSVLEALVAMAVLAAALIPLLALQGQFLRTTESLERVERRLAVQDLALAHVKTLNLDEYPDGQISTPYGALTWTSRPAAGPAPARGTGGFPARYTATLYAVDVTLSPGPEQSQKPIERFTLQALGWSPTASVLDSL